MKVNLYSVRDVKAGAYNVPFCASNDAIAGRMLGGVVNGNRETSLARYPEDFQLFRIGTFSDDDGVVSPEVPAFVLNATDLVVRSDSDVRESE